MIISSLTILSVKIEGENMKDNSFLEFTQLSEVDLQAVNGGRNNWKDNVGGAWGAAAAGAALGGAVGGPVGAFVGAHYGAVGWVAVTGATGGF